MWRSCDGVASRCLQQTLSINSAAVQRRVPRAAHSTAASEAVTYSPLNAPVIGATNPDAETSLVQIESWHVDGPLTSQHWIAAVAGARVPQSVQSVPSAHWSYSAPSPPSSQASSLASEHESLQSGMRTVVTPRDA